MVGTGTHFDNPVSLIGGPRSGQVEYVDAPVPRFGYVNVDDGAPGSGLAKYRLEALDIGGTTVWQGVYVPPGQDATADEQTTEGEPGPTGPAGEPGPQGPQGPAGDDGATYTHRGTWSGTTSYHEGDTVLYNGNGYVAATDVIGTAPPSAPWGQIAAKGDTGAASTVPGPTGPVGPQGIQGDPGSPLPYRLEQEVTTGTIAAGVGQSLDVPLGAGYRVLRIEANFACRIRLYTTHAKRDADVLRDTSQDPLLDHGCVLEVLLTSTLLGIDLSPVPQGYSFDYSGGFPDEDIACRVDNTSGASHVFTLTFTIQPQELYAT